MEMLFILLVLGEVNTPDSKVHGANMGPIWGRQDPGGPHVGPMNFVIWDPTTPTPITKVHLWRGIFVVNLKTQVNK